MGYSNNYNGTTERAQMQKRHFALIAEATAALPARGRRKLAEHFADRLAGTNPLFHRDHFLAVCMGEKAPMSMPYRPRMRRG